MFESKGCPWCSRRTHVEAGRTDSCVHCKKPVGSVKGRYVALFSAPLSEGASFPNRCCACESEPTRAVALEVEETQLLGSLLGTAFVFATGGIGYSHSSKKARLEVPYCDKHDEGVFLQVEPPALLFADKAAHSAFRAHNQRVAIGPKERVA